MSRAALRNRLVTVLLGSLLAHGCASAGPAGAREPQEPPDKPIAVALQFSEAPAGPDDTPRTRVSLVRLRKRTTQREVTDLGVYDGVCNHGPVRGDMVLHARCWWAGAGVTFEVIRHGLTLIVRRRPVGKAASRQDSEVIARIDLPDEVVLDPIRPQTLPEVR